MTKQESNQAQSRPDYASAPRLLWAHLNGRGPLPALAIGCGIVAGIAEVTSAWAMWKAVTSIAESARTSGEGAAQTVLLMALI